MDALRAARDVLELGVRCGGTWERRSARESFAGPLALTFEKEVIPMSRATASFVTAKSISSGRTARELVARGAVLLDVRTPEEFRDEHVPGAVNVPLQELTARLGEVGPRDRTVVVYCRSGRRSAEAARLLEHAGFRHVHDMGAMLEWANR